MSETGKAYAAQRSKECRLAPKSLSEVVSSARDWTVHFDHLGNDAYAYQHYPLEVSATAERPDILLRSRANRTVVAIELTCPDEQAMQKAFDRKSRRYNHLILDGKANNYTVLVMPIEVGVLGYVARSTWNVLRALRFTKSQLATIKCQLEDVARRLHLQDVCAPEHVILGAEPAAATSERAMRQYRALAQVHTRNESSDAKCH